jgi:type I restriction enzyme S subunit
VTPRDLLAAFDVLAEAPGGTQRLRALVLELAVRGKLVPQDPRDEPASALLGARRLDLAEMDSPFDIPRGWAWTCLRNLGDFISGGTPSKSNSRYWDGRIPWVSPKDMKIDWLEDSQDHVSATALDETSLKLVSKGAVLMVVRGMILAHSFPVASNLTDVTINQDMKALVPFRDGLVPFLLLLLKGTRDRILDLVERSTHGTCKLPSEKVALLPVAIPPPSEQGRIVARVDELMAVLDRLEAARRAREAARVGLRDAALAAVRNAPDAAAVEVAWARVVERMDELFTAPADVAPLRQTILQLAVRGKLVPQDPRDEPASVLLDRIVAEKARLVREGELRASKSLPTVSADEAPFELPKGWAMIRFGEIFLDIFTGPFGTSLKASEYVPRGTPVINPQNMRGGRLAPTSDTNVGAATLERLATFILRTNDVIVARRGEMGRCAVVTEREDGWLCGTGSLTLRPSSGLLSTFVALFLRSPGTVARLAGDSVGSTMDNLNQRIMVHLPFGLPPTAEQARIVAKVDELMALCDQLEARLRAVQETQKAFAAAAVHHLDT